MSRAPKSPESTDAERRRFLRGSLQALAAGLAGSLAAKPAAAIVCGADAFGALQAPDATGLRLPAGFQSRVVATTGNLVSGTTHTWHSNPDGGEVFAAPASDPMGGWAYVSNDESNNGNGGVGVLRFDAAANIIDAYSILTGTSRNCAGGPTPWGSWLSCEEVSFGRVYECDPFDPGSQGVLRSGLGTFTHEAAAVDPVHEHVYLTEDRNDSALYRFVPDAYPNLDLGSLEVAEVLDPLGAGPISPGEVRPLAWHPVPNPNPVAGQTQTRHQVAAATHFRGGEGCYWAEGRIVFSTKGDNRVWAIDTKLGKIEILYEFATSPDPELRNVDNVYVSSCGDIYVAEDPGDLQIVALTPSGGVTPILQLTGVSGTEITGPSLSPDGQRLYFSSQRNPGTTFEVTGPFAPVPAVPAMGGAGSAFLAMALAGFGARFAQRARKISGDLPRG